MSYRLRLISSRMAPPGPPNPSPRGSPSCTTKLGTTRCQRLPSKNRRSTSRRKLATVSGASGPSSSISMTPALIGLDLHVGPRHGIGRDHEPADEVAIVLQAYARSRSDTRVPSGRAASGQFSSAHRRMTVVGGPRRTGEKLAIHPGLRLRSRIVRIAAIAPSADERGLGKGVAAGAAVGLR